jgi:hypothetical protein
MESVTGYVPAQLKKRDQNLRSDYSINTPRSRDDMAANFYRAFQSRPQLASSSSSLALDW